MLEMMFETGEDLGLAIDRGEAGPVAGLRPVYDYLVGVRQKKVRGGRSGRKRSGRLPSIGVGGGQLSRMIPVAPLRSKPKRTYDPIRDSASPDGEHVPMLMMRLARTDKPHWTSLHDDLVRFGRASGLFSNIKVKRHGRQMSDPFQLQVKVRTGPHANLMDVGYGISQSLPILVDLMHEEQSVFLLQQPEVHLHPRGQAELASLFVESCKKRGNRFLVETHSDYIVDRVRILVRRGELEAGDVSVLYFEPNGNAVTIHNMTLDQDGNLVDAPEGYRDFFLKETDRTARLRSVGTTGECASSWTPTGWAPFSQTRRRRTRPRFAGGSTPAEAVWCIPPEGSLRRKSKVAQGKGCCATPKLAGPSSSRRIVSLTTRTPWRDRSDPMTPMSSRWQGWPEYVFSIPEMPT